MIGQLLGKRDVFIEAPEDSRVYILASQQGPGGMETAKKHANRILAEAMQLFAAGDVESALVQTEREVAFNLRTLGPDHPFTRSAHACLQAMRRLVVKTARA